MATNTVYNPAKVADFSKEFLNFQGVGVYGEANESTTINIDHTLTDDVLMTGASLLVKNAKFEDKICLQIVHPTYGVVNEFVTDWYMVEDSQKQINMNIEYPAKLAAGLTIRLVYKAYSTVGLRDVACNYFLHKVLI